MTNQKIAVIVLAGGQSSRMGTDKALLEIDGKSLLQRVLTIASIITPEVYIMTPWPDRYLAIAQTAYTFSKKPKFLVESNPGSGPLVALAQGLTDISADWILLLACDLPLLNPLILGDWASKLKQFPPSTLAVVPRHKSRWEPLCGFYHQQSLPSLQSFIDKGERSFQLWLNQIKATRISVGKRAVTMLSNCNTLEDFENFKSVIDQYK